MKRLLKTFTVITIVSALTLQGFAFAPYSGKSLGESLDSYKAENGMDESNFGFAYFNTVTGETYFDNADKWMTGGSTYKFPLNLYLYELQNNGVITPNTLIDGQKLSYLQYRSIVYSDNEASTTLYKYLGYYNFKAAVSEFSDVDIPESFYSTNVFSAHYMLDVLKRFYFHKQDFPTLHEHLLIASPNKALKKYVTEYPIAYKTGTYDGAYNSVGVVYTPTPYLIAVYTQGYNYDYIGEINRLVCDYTLAANTDVDVEIKPVAVTVDGIKIWVESTNIDGNIYLPLRTLAALINTTRYRFAVSWSRDITMLTSGQSGESGTGSPLWKSSGHAVLNSQPLTLDGDNIYVKKYSINGATYVKIRDMAQILGFTLSWNGNLTIE